MEDCFLSVTDAALCCVLAEQWDGRGKEERACNKEQGRVGQNEGGGRR